jgi:DNA-binding CsgD family transcriptional regulator
MSPVHRRPRTRPSTGVDRAALAALHEQVVRVEADLRNAVLPDPADLRELRRRIEALVPAPDRSARDGWAALTRAELAVVRAVVRGLTNREAGAALFVSPHTVNAHLRHAFAKLGVHSRVELVRVALGHDVDGVPR